MRKIIAAIENRKYPPILGHNLSGAISPLTFPEPGVVGGEGGVAVSDPTYVEVGGGGGGGGGNTFQLNK